MLTTDVYLQNLSLKCRQNYRLHFKLYHAEYWSIITLLGHVKFNLITRIRNLFIKCFGLSKKSNYCYMIKFTFVQGILRFMTFINNADIKIWRASGYEVHVLRNYLVHIILPFTFWFTRNSTYREDIQLKRWYEFLLSPILIKVPII